MHDDFDCVRVVRWSEHMRKLSLDVLLILKIVLQFHRLLLLALAL